MSTFKEKVKNLEKVSGTYININDPCVSSIAARVGFDFIWIDMEHSYLSYQNLLAHINTIQNAGTPVLVRPPQRDFTATKKILEMGPDGLIFPMMKCRADVEEMINYTLYPPYGNRGYGPLNAVHNGVDDAKDYYTHNHERMCRFVQIEQASIVDELDEICKNPYVDGFIFGAFDLSGSLGELGNLFGEKTQNCIKRAMEILRKNNKFMGILMGGGDVEAMRRWSDMGMHLISCNADLDILAKGFMATREEMRYHTK